MQICVRKWASSIAATLLQFFWVAALGVVQAKKSFQVENVRIGEQNVRTKLLITIKQCTHKKT